MSIHDCRAGGGVWVFGTKLYAGKDRETDQDLCFIFSLKLLKNSEMSMKLEVNSYYLRGG